MTTARNVASSAAAAEQSWSWWMNNGVSAIRVQNVSDAENNDESDGPNSKMPRLDDNDNDNVDDDDDDDDDDGYYWNDSTTTIACPLDLSMKATVATTTTTTEQQQQPACRGRRSECDAYGATPVKKKSATTGKSSKKTAGKTTAVGVRPSAIKAVTRKLLPQLMLDRTSPVSGTIITAIANSTGGSAAAAAEAAADDYDGDDIDPEYNIVAATDDARRRLESIPNVLGPYRCRLCGVRYADAFALARHRCRCIVHVRYRCPECDKVFQCPANLASHRRWHGTAASSVKTAGGGRAECKLDAACNNNNNNNNDDDDDDGDNTDDTDEDVVVARVDSTAVTVSCTGSVTTAAGFKKNILQRAVRAAAAAAARIHDENGACT